MRARLIAVPVAAVLFAAGCSSDNADDERELPVPGTGEDESGSDEKPEETDEATEAAEEEAELRALFGAYWDAVIELENSGELDPSLFDGIATDGVTETELSRVEPAKASGHTREGAPEIGEVTVEVENGEALLQACVNAEDWLLYKDGELVDLDHEASPSVAVAERNDDGWLISQVGLYEKATITC